MFHSNSEIWGSPGAIVQSFPTNPFSSDKSTLDSLSVMRAITIKDACSPEVLHLAYWLSQRCPTPRAYAQSVWFWCHDHLRFVNHEDVVETQLAHEAPIPLDSQLLIPPSSLLRMPEPMGDCAIYSTLVAALLITKGINSFFRVVCADASEPDVWGHVYVMCEINGEVISMDTSHGHYFGWETPNKLRQLDYRI